MERSPNQRLQSDPVPSVLLQRQLQHFLPRMAWYDKPFFLHNWPRNCKHFAYIFKQVRLRKVTAICLVICTTKSAAWVASTVTSSAWRIRAVTLRSPRTTPSVCSRSITPERWTWRWVRLETRPNTASTYLYQVSLYLL